MFPNSARSGQKGIPSSHPCRFGDAVASGRNVYGSAHGSAAVLELVPGKPECPAELEVISGRRLAVAGGRPGEVAAAAVLDGGPRRPQRARCVED